MKPNQTKCKSEAEYYFNPGFGRPGISVIGPRRDDRTCKYCAGTIVNPTANQKTCSKADCKLQMKMASDARKSARGMRNRPGSVR